MAANNSARPCPTVFILDVDGVMTDGKFVYSEQGKLFKTFGPDDNDALSLLDSHMEIRFVTGDSRGFDISKKRIVEDMKRPLDLISTTRRLDWIREQYDPRRTAYMGDGIFDALVFMGVGYSIAPANACDFAKEAADFVTKRAGGDRAVADACIHLFRHFFGLETLEEMYANGSKAAGQWSL